MKEPSIGGKIAAIAGIPVSFSACLWLLSLPRDPLVLPRLGFAAAVLGNLTILTYCWAAVIAYIAGRRKWSPRVCYMTGALSFIVPIFLLILLANRSAESLIGLFAFPLTIAGIFCRKLAYPEMSDEEATAPEPLISLFPR